EANDVAWASIPSLPASPAASFDSDEIAPSLGPSLPPLINTRASGAWKICRADSTKVSRKTLGSAPRAVSSEQAVTTLSMTGRGEVRGRGRDCPDLGLGFTKSGDFRRERPESTLESHFESISKLRREPETKPPKRSQDETSSAYQDRKR